MRVILCLFLLVFFVNVAYSNPGEGSEYTKTYYQTGVLQAEGWIKYETKNGYWKFYHPNGQIASEGHYSNNQKTGYWYFYNTHGDVEKEGYFLNDNAEDWWIFYEIGTRNSKKLQFKDGVKDGVCLIYKRNKLVKAQRYKANQKMGEWTSVFAFKRDNPDLSLK